MISPRKAGRRNSNAAPAHQERHCAPKPRKGGRPDAKNHLLRRRTATAAGFWAHPASAAAPAGVLIGVSMHQDAWRHFFPTDRRPVTACTSGRGAEIRQVPDRLGTSLPTATAEWEDCA